MRQRVRLEAAHAVLGADGAAVRLHAAIDDVVDALFLRAQEFDGIRASQ